MCYELREYVFSAHLMQLDGENPYMELVLAYGTLTICLE